MHRLRAILCLTAQSISVCPKMHWLIASISKTQMWLNITRKDHHNSEILNHPTQNKVIMSGPTLSNLVSLIKPTKLTNPSYTFTTSIC